MSRDGMSGGRDFYAFAVTAMTARTVTTEAGEPGLLVEATAAGDASVIPRAVLCGIFLGILYDGFRILRTALGIRTEEHVSDKTTALRRITRRRIDCTSGEVPCPDRHPKAKRGHLPGRLVQFILDILYAVLAACVFAVFLYHRDTGVLRWYTVLACAVGFFAYYHTVGRAVMRGCAFLLAFLRAVIIVFYNRILFPVLRLLYRMLCGIRGRCAVVSEHRKERRRLRRESRRMLKQQKKTGKKNKEKEQGKRKRLYGKRKKSTAEKGELFHPHRVFRLPRILRHHHLPDDVTDQ
ncbi:MAG: spore cortex biosynthesis protein YabQ [Clostridia bacterium]|nr:spore cortex biosynthesis protein YabQ [Clostridia bacterium]